jgi:hypothetical protein
MADKPKVYVETTVISYLTARPSNELVAAAHQEITKEWWAIKRERFELFVSELVLQEAGAGDQEASQRRLGILASIPLLKPDQQTRRLASLLASSTNIPQRALADLAHVAVAVTNGMDYLVTWNCRHIANAQLRSVIDRVCSDQGFVAPVICTPEELMEELPHD